MQLRCRRDGHCQSHTIAISFKIEFTASVCVLSMSVHDANNVNFIDHDASPVVSSTHLHVSQTTWTGSVHHRYVRCRYLLESRRRLRRPSHEGTVVDAIDAIHLV